MTKAQKYSDGDVVEIVVKGTVKNARPYGSGYGVDAQAFNVEFAEPKHRCTVPIGTGDAGNQRQAYFNTYFGDDTAVGLTIVKRAKPKPKAGETVEGEDEYAALPVGTVVCRDDWRSGGVLIRTTAGFTAVDGNGKVTRHEADEWFDRRVILHIPA